MNNLHSRNHRDLIPITTGFSFNILLGMVSLVSLFIPTIAGAQTNQSSDWIDLLAGEDLSNWSIKFTGYELDHNLNDTFRLEEGRLLVSYDKWDEFNGEFGHIFYNQQSFSHYRLRAEYRFAGDQVNKGPDWAYRNNGLMLHSQSPASMAVDQEFPASIEVQLLGGNGVDERSTANVCSPGTHYVSSDKLVTTHCINSSTATFHGDQWVSIEVEVRGDDRIIHRVNGEVVFDYAKPQLDPTDHDAQQLLNTGAALALKEGYIALQAESHPTEFRRLELLPLTP